MTAIFDKLLYEAININWKNEPEPSLIELSTIMCLVAAIALVKQRDC